MGLVRRSLLLCDDFINMRQLLIVHPIAASAFLVFLVAFVTVAWGVSGTGIAAAYNDPIAHIRAQDEAPIVSATIGMTKDSDWMTPKLMGRPFILKPPLLNWLSALSIRVFGLSLFSVRFPALLLGALGVAMVFAWCVQARSMAAGVLGGGTSLTKPFLANLFAFVPYRCALQFILCIGSRGCRF